MDVDISLSDTIGEEEVLTLYRANAWSSAEKPAQLLAALRGSHALVTARVSGELVGLGNAISDGHLVVYFPHMLVLPGLHGHGIGRKMMQAFLEKYESFHQLMPTGVRSSSTSNSASSEQATQSRCGYMRAPNIERLRTVAGQQWTVNDTRHFNNLHA